MLDPAESLESCFFCQVGWACRLKCSILLKLVQMVARIDCSDLADWPMPSIRTVWILLMNHNACRQSGSTKCNETHEKHISHCVYAIAQKGGAKREAMQDVHSFDTRTRNDSHGFDAAICSCSTYVCGIVEPCLQHSYCCKSCLHFCRRGCLKMDNAGLNVLLKMGRTRPVDHHNSYHNTADGSCRCLDIYEGKRAEASVLRRPSTRVSTADWSVDRNPPCGMPERIGAALQGTAAYNHTHPASPFIATATCKELVSLEDS